jgi:hypothetical protein
LFFLTEPALMLIAQECRTTSAANKTVVFKIVFIVLKELNYHYNLIPLRQ